MRIFTLLFLVSVLASCSSTMEVSSLTMLGTEEAKRMMAPARPLPQGRQPIRISVEADGIVSSVDIRNQKEGRIERMKEMVYATEFGPVAGLDSEESFSVAPVTPAKPTKFGKADVGFSLRMTPTLMDNGEVHVRGLVVASGGERHPLVYGEGAGPIAALGDGRFGKKVPVIVTENRQESFILERIETPVLLKALPGKTYTIDVKTMEGFSPVQLTVLAR
ncbi:MAG: hypothetical protein AAF514_10780 [Verrucomicrobiota bacterium]